MPNLEDAAFLRPLPPAVSASLRLRTPIHGAWIPRAAFVASLALGFVVSALQAGDLSAGEGNDGNVSIPNMLLSQPPLPLSDLLNDVLRDTPQKANS